MKTPTRYASLVAIASAAVLLAACGKTEDGTVGQRLDGAVNDVQSAANEIRNDARSAAQDAQEASTQAGQAITESASDMAITAKVNAALAADEKLSALKINVDTEAGRVALNGTAPDADSRERATTLAAAVDGVVAVDNRLTVKKDS